MAAKQQACELVRGEPTGSASMSQRNGIPNVANNAVYSTMGAGYAVRHEIETASPAKAKPDYDPAEHPENNDPKFPSIIKKGFPTHFQDRDAAYSFMEEKLAEGVDINSVDRYGNTALHYNYEFPEVVCWLLDHGADINARNKDMWTALHLACDDYNDKYNAALMLVEHGADPNAQGTRGRTPLHLACYKHMKSGQSRAQMIKMLLGNGADANMEWEEGTPLHASVISAYQEPELEEPEVLHALIMANANVNQRAVNDNNTPLQRLVQLDENGHDHVDKNVEVLKYLIANKADYVSPCGNGVPPKRAAKSTAMRNFFVSKN
eukprot:TRINITY_DN9039_c0_g1_i5.p1 TRINITY_DN9039_c0_g1~~TRINITY_DN9039_c0_g1_i5.p1  ORF type:complete len:321 (-),score=83.97 TRINITY_DN9039_c0_g1_i5:160-1122(-)